MLLTSGDSSFCITDIFFVMFVIREFFKDFHAFKADMKQCSNIEVAPSELITFMFMYSCHRLVMFELLYSTIFVLIANITTQKLLKTLGRTFRHTLVPLSTPYKPTLSYCRICFSSRIIICCENLLYALRV